MKPRALTVVTVVTVAAASAALLAYLLFISQRNLVTTGDAHLQRWVNPDAARWTYLAITVLLLTAFVATAVLGTRPSVAGEGGSPEEQPWRIGAAAGAALGLVLGLAALVGGAVATTMGPLTAPIVGVYLAMLAGAPLIGGWAAQSTGRTGSGTLAGVWYGLFLALLAGFALVARDVVFAGRLSSGAWLLDRFGDPTCNHTTGDTLRACEIGDSLGAMANQWLTFPLAGAGLAALGGLIGKATTRTRLPSPDRWRLPVLAPLGLCTILVIVFAAVATLQIW